MANERSGNALRGAASTLPKRPSIKNEAGEESPVKTDHRGMVRQTLYMPPGVHEAIRDVAHAKHVSQQAVWRQAMSYYLSREMGVGTWDELDDRPEHQKKKAGEQ